jgi:hypothetical protein
MDWLDHYRQHGYAVLKGAIPPPAMAALTAELEGALRRSYGDQTGHAAHEQAVLTLGSDTPLLAQALEQAFLHAPAQALYGDDVLGIACYGTSHTGDTGWHADSPREHPEGVKFSIYVEPTRADSGALRVWPGSHRAPVHQEARAFVQSGVADADVPATLCPSDPGDVVVFDLRLFHAALGGGGDRRVINAFYYRNPTTPEQDRLVREQIVEDYQWLTDKNRGGHVFDPHWLANEGDDAVRQGWIDRFDALGFFDLERSGKLDAAATPLPESIAGALTNAAGPWSLVDGSVKTELLRARFETDEGDVLLLVRPADDPHPAYRKREGLAVAYSTLDCRPLEGARLSQLDRLVEAAVGCADAIKAAIA